MAFGTRARLTHLVPVAPGARRSGPARSLPNRLRPPHELCRTPIPLEGMGSNPVHRAHPSLPVLPLRVDPEATGRVALPRIRGADRERRHDRPRLALPGRDDRLLPLILVRRAPRSGNVPEPLLLHLTRRIPPDLPPARPLGFTGWAPPAPRLRSTPPVDRARAENPDRDRVLFRGRRQVEPRLASSRRASRDLALGPLRPPPRRRVPSTSRGLPTWQAGGVQSSTSPSRRSSSGERADPGRTWRWWAFT